MLMLGNLFKECGVVERLSRTASNELINIVTILLGLAVGSKLAADKFLSIETLGIIALGLVAFGIGTACGVLLARVMNFVCPLGKRTYQSTYRLCRRLRSPDGCPGFQ